MLYFYLTRKSCPINIPGEIAMKKRILIPIIMMMLASLTITGCDSSTIEEIMNSGPLAPYDKKNTPMSQNKDDEDSDEKEISKSKKDSRSKKDSDPDSDEKSDSDSRSGYTKADFAGTYIGLHGSGITLFENGKAEYFCKEWTSVETNDDWFLEDNRLTLYSQSLGYKVYADIEGNNITSFTFTSDSSSWADEMFVKVDSDSNAKDTDTYIALIEKQLGIKVDAATGTCRIRTPGFTYDFPEDYRKMKSEDQADMYVNNDNTALVIAFSDNLGVENMDKVEELQDTFEELMDESINELVFAALFDDEDIETGDMVDDHAKPQGSIGNTHHFSYIEDARVGMVYESWMLNQNTGDIDYFIFIDLDDNFKNSNDYVNVIKNAKMNDAEASASSSPSTAGGSGSGSGSGFGTGSGTDSGTGSLSGLDEELKKFLNN